MLKTKDEIKLWLDINEIENYTINDDLTVDVDSEVTIIDDLTTLPVKFNRVSGYFGTGTYLESLEGCPNYVDGDFNCSGSQIVTLIGAPSVVEGTMLCYDCVELISLEGAPKRVGKNLNLMLCKSLRSLKGAPEYVGGNFSCRECTALETLEGGPIEVGGFFSCALCPNLASLKGLPLSISSDLIIDPEKKNDHYLQFSSFSGIETVGRGYV